MNRLLFHCNLNKPCIAIAWMFFCLSLSVSNPCLSQFGNLKQISVPQVPSMNFGANEGMIADLLKGKNDLKTLQENYDKLKSKLDSFRLSLSDSTNNINKDSLKNELIEQLELQQQFLESLQESTDILGQNDLIPTRSESMRDALDKLEGEYSKGELIEILERTQVFLTESFKQRMMVFVEGINLLDLPNNLSNADLGGTAAALFEAIGDGFNVEDLPTDLAKQAVSGRINRKVGFENIEFKEVITQAQFSEKEPEYSTIWKIGILYNLSERFSLSSLVHGYLAVNLSPGASMVFGGGLKLKNHNDLIQSSGYGLNAGFRQDIYKNWFFQAIYERNQITRENPKPYQHLDFNGNVHEGSIGLGKSIALNRYIGTVITGTWSPFYSPTKSLHSSRFGLVMGFELIKTKKDN